MVRVGYIGNLFLSDSRDKIDEVVEEIMRDVSGRELNALICSGGISYNFHTTLDFVNQLGKRLKEQKILFGFIAGNTDFYYPMSEMSIDKEKKFRMILGFYRANPYYLPTHTIKFNNLRITGYETWYDYTLYRGRGLQLKDITKKRRLLYYNKDVKYITDASDYTLGVSDTFDVRYTKETCGLMVSKMDDLVRDYVAPAYNVVVQYFSPTKAIFADDKRYYYRDTFAGSVKYLEILSRFKVTECIVGTDSCKSPNAKYHGITFTHPYKTITEVEYAN